MGTVFFMPKWKVWVEQIGILCLAIMKKMKNVIVAEDSGELGRVAAEKGLSIITKRLEDSGKARVILATGASQFDVLKSLVASKDVDWTKVEVFHLDEYINIPTTHPASFLKYLQERFIDQVEGPKVFHGVNGSADDLALELKRLDQLIKEEPIDVAFIGIGENGHLAFNDPPADFEITDAYIEVTLDEACRRQQFGEGWFETLEAVPKKAISMTIQQILSANHLIVSVPDRRKAEAVRNAIEGPLTNSCPASILRTHASCHLFLDKNSAALLT